MTKIKDVYEILDKFAPFNAQEKWDNSGLLVGNYDREVTKILLALDITSEVSVEAAEKGAELIISHHPVIFSPLKRLDEKNPAVILAKNNISAICLHTNLDIADNGMNDILCEKLGFSNNFPLIIQDGTELGRICELEKDYSASELAMHIKKCIGTKSLRYNNNSNHIRKVAVCSGSGGSYLNDVIKNQCDAFITGDVKHDVFIDANNSLITVFDAGHFYTENIFFERIKELILGGISNTSISIAESNRDILTYL